MVHRRGPSGVLKPPHPTSQPTPAGQLQARQVKSQQAAQLWSHHRALQPRPAACKACDSTALRPAARPRQHPRQAPPGAQVLLLPTVNLQCCVRAQVGRRPAWGTAPLSCWPEGAPLPGRRMGDPVLRGEGCLLGEGCLPGAACCELEASWGRPRSVLTLRLTSPDLQAQLQAGCCSEHSPVRGARRSACMRALRPDNSPLVSGALQARPCMHTGCVSRGQPRQRREMLRVHS